MSFRGERRASRTSQQETHLICDKSWDGDIARLYNRFTRSMFMYGDKRVLSHPLCVIVCPSPNRTPTIQLLHSSEIITVLVIALVIGEPFAANGSRTTAGETGQHSVVCPSRTDDYIANRINMCNYAGKLYVNPARIYVAASGP